MEWAVPSSHIQFVAAPLRNSPIQWKHACLFMKSCLGTRLNHLHGRRMDTRDENEADVSQSGPVCCNAHTLANHTPFFPEKSAIDFMELFAPVPHGKHHSYRPGWEELIGYPGEQVNTIVSSARGITNETWGVLFPSSTSTNPTAYPASVKERQSLILFSDGFHFIDFNGGSRDSRWRERRLRP